MQISETTKQIGNFGERMAVRYLRLHGYTVKERNWRSGHMEIDIIAANFKTLAFVEVKTRTKYYGKSIYGSAASAVDKRKQMHIISAARSYLQEKRLRRIPRFDVIEVYVEKTDNSFKVVNVNHLPRAFASGR